VAAFVEYPQYLDTQILHHVGRLKGEMGRNGSPLFYLLATLLMTLPWTPLILVGVIGGMRQRFWRAALWRFVACWFVVGITLLVVCPFQRKYYLAPLLPPLSFVAAISLLGYVRLRITNSFAMHLIQGIAVMTACSSAAAVVTIIQPRQWTTILALISILSAGSLCTAFFLLRRQPRATLVSIFAAALVVIVGATSFVLPAHDSYRDLADLGRRANRLCPQGTTVYFFGLPDSSITYYLDHPTIRLDHPGKLESGLPRTRGTVYLFTPADQQRYLEPFGTVTQLDQCSSLQRHLPPEQRRLFVRLELREKRLAKRGDGVHSDGEMDK
jgi:4-amino-4-deoxy-L-arabinose transferase-like glycosyltransferase